MEFNTQFAFINLLYEANNWLTPANGDWQDGVNFFTAGNLGTGAKFGFPSNSSTKQFGGGFHYPTPMQYTGSYCFDGIDTSTGSTINLPNVTWTASTSGSCATLGANGAVTGGTSACSGANATYNAGTNNITVPGNGTNGYWYICMTPNSGGGQASQPTIITATDGTLGSFSVYMSADTTDRAAGKLFRTGFKQPIVKLNPGAIRFLNWIGGLTRWEYRPTLAQPGYGGNTRCTSLPYTTTSGTDAYTLPSVSPSGCTTLSSGTPVSSQHGEFLIAYIGNSSTTFGGGTGSAAFTNCAISSIATGNPTTINTAGNCIAAGQTGKTVIIYLQDIPTTDSNFCATGQLKNLHLFPVTATFVSATQFTVNFNSTSGTYTSSGQCYVAPYVTLNVGGRGAFPVVGFDGYSSTSFNPFSGSSLTYLTANTYVIFTFDKNSVAKTDGSGNNVAGVWRAGISNNGVNGPHVGAPIEVAVALINEINAMYTTQPPTHMWINFPGNGIIPQDADYSSASDWGLNQYNLIMNNLTCKRCGLLIEFDNETWNNGIGTPLGSYQRQGWLRWGNGADDFSSMSTFRGILQATNIINNATTYPTNAFRTRFILGIQGGFGTQGRNATRIAGVSTSGGNNFVNTDAQNPLNTNTTFTGTISGSTLTMPSISGAFGIGYNVNYTGAGPCIVTAGSGLSWTVQSFPASAVSATLTNCTGASGVAMTAAKAPMMLFDKIAGAPYMSASNTQSTTDFTNGANDYTASGAGSPAVQNDIYNAVSNLIGRTVNCGALPDGNIPVYCWQLLQAGEFSVLGMFPGTKEAVNYEGGISVDANGNPVDLTAVTNAQNFINLIHQHRAWADAQYDFSAQSATTANSALPVTTYLNVCNNAPVQGVPDWLWSSACPDPFGGTTTEGAGYSKIWLRMGDYNAQQGN